MQPLQSVESARSAQPDELPESTLFMPADEAATLFGISPEHVRRSITRGVIPGIKVGGTYRVFRSFVSAVLAEMEAGRSVDFGAFATRSATVSEVAS